MTALAFVGVNISGPGIERIEQDIFSRYIAEAQTQEFLIETAPVGDGWPAECRLIAVIKRDPIGFRYLLRHLAHH